MCNFRRTQILVSDDFYRLCLIATFLFSVLLQQPHTPDEFSHLILLFDFEFVGLPYNCGGQRIIECSNGKR